MIKFIINFFIKNFIRFTELLQALTTIDIYAFVRIIEERNLNNFLRDHFYKSFEVWKIESKKIDDELYNLHNITYNHWIRSYVGYKLASKNVIFGLFYYLTLLNNYFLLIFLLLKVKFFRTKIITNETKINSNKDNYQYKFVSFQKKSRFHDNARYLKDSFDESIIYNNLKIYFTNFSLFNIFRKSKNQIFINKIIKYCLIYPFMTRHFMKMFQALYVYDYFSKIILKEKCYSLTKEIYSMESRSLSIASLEFAKSAYVIEHNKFEALPYDMYSLNMPIKQKNLNSLLNKKNKVKIKYQKSNYKKNIVIQASDICGSTISSYEFNTYKDIIECLQEIEYKGEVTFKYHPANIKFFVFLKTLICKNFLNNNKDINFKFIHKTKNIEFYALQSNLVISIDYSTSFLNILGNSIPLVYFNRNFDRQIINNSSRVYSYEKFKMVSLRKELKIALTNLL